MIFDWRFQHFASPHQPPLFCSVNGDAGRDLCTLFGDNNDSDRLVRIQRDGPLGERAKFLAFDTAAPIRSAIANSEMLRSSAASLDAPSTSTVTPAGFPGAVNLMRHTP
jgi:hypothetical protein